MVRFAASLACLNALVLSLGMIAAASTSAWAQSSTAALTVDQIRACMCEEQTIADLRQNLAQSQAKYDQSNAHIQKLTQQIQQLQTTMDPNDTMAQDQLRELIDLRARVEQDMYEQDLPRLQKATRDLNNEVADYNNRCAAHTIYELDQAAAAKNLVCPKQ